MSTLAHPHRRPAPVILDSIKRVLGAVTAGGTSLASVWYMVTAGKDLLSWGLGTAAAAGSLWMLYWSVKSLQASVDVRREEKLKLRDERERADFEFTQKLRRELLEDMARKQRPPAPSDHMP